MNKSQREAVRLRLEELTAANGGVLTPEAVVSDAQDEDSPLHQCFEWDVGKAAHAHWLDQARAIITAVRVDFKIHRTIVSTVAYVRDPDARSGEQGYRATAELRTDAEAARAAICDEFSRVADFLRRARELAKVLGAQEDVDGLLSAVVTLRRRFEQPPPPQTM